MDRLGHGGRMAGVVGLGVGVARIEAGEQGGGGGKVGARDLRLPAPEVGAHEIVLIWVMAALGLSEMIVGVDRIPWSAVIPSGRTATGVYLRCR